MRVEKKGSRTAAKCEIVEQTEVAPHVMRTVLVNEIVAANSRPGQFVNVRVCDCTDPLLRRPFSVHSAEPEKGLFTLLYDVRGRGTELLSKLHKGDHIDMVGPLGTSFDLGDSPTVEHVLVAGGCGAAPLHFLTDALCQKWDCNKVTVLVGARSGEHVLCEREFRAHGTEVAVSTDDGSYGHPGLVTDLLRIHLESGGPDLNVRVYSCGPMAMMQAVAKIADEYGCHCQVSLERSMACGVGVCMGCVVKGCDHTHDDVEHECGDWKYKRVCTEGPVFDAKELVWE